MIDPKPVAAFVELAVVGPCLLGEPVPCDDGVPVDDEAVTAEDQGAWVPASPGFDPAFPVFGFTLPLVDQLSSLVPLGAVRV